MILLFGVHDESYPRNRMLREQLRRWTAESVVLVPIEWRFGPVRRALKLFASGFVGSRGASVIFLGEFSLQYACIAWLIAKIRRIPLVVDHFVGVYETHVLDYHTTPVRKRRKLYFRGVDWLAFRLADIATIDTKVRAERLAQAYARGGPPVIHLPVGAPAWAKLGENRIVPNDDVLQLLYYGNYIPLHGVGYLIDSLAALPSGTNYHLTLIGSSSGRDAIEARVMDAGISNRCSFLDAMPEHDLAAHIAASHIIIGIFGESHKAETVLANKVWQGLYAGRTVVTRTSPALGELSVIVGSQLIPVETSDPQALATALLPFASMPSAAIHTPSTAELDAYVENSYDVLFEALRIQRF
jgi:glycosyltransferase involved in cell wall biosynthesis